MTIQSRFPLGQLVATQNALDRLTQSDIQEALGRHAWKDWGDVSIDDFVANNDAVTNGSRILSAYMSPDGVRFWIVTEADRSATTILLPTDY